MWREEAGGTISQSATVWVRHVKYFCSFNHQHSYYWPGPDDKLRMRIWCIPKSTSLDLPSLPPRIDRDVFIRSPPPPPRLSKQEKLARGVIVYKTKRHKDKHQKPPPHSHKASSLKSSSKPVRKVRYADLVEEEEAVEAKLSDERVPHRGEILHSRQQSNTSGTSSSCLDSNTASSSSLPASHQYSSSSGLGSSAEAVPSSPSPTCDHSETSSSPGSTLTSTLSTSYRSRRSDRSCRSSRTRVKKTVSRSTLSLSVGGFSKRCSLVSDLKKSSSCDDSNVILYPGISRTRERRERAKTKPKRKGADMQRWIIRLAPSQIDWIIQIRYFTTLLSISCPYIVSVQFWNLKRKEIGGH